MTPRPKRETVEEMVLGLVDVRLERLRRQLDVWTGMPIDKLPPRILSHVAQKIGAAQELRRLRRALAKRGKR